MTIFLSIDLELFEHTQAKNIKSKPSVTGLRRLLSLLDERKKESTFFIVSEVLKKDDTIRNIFKNNLLDDRYEICSHSETHSNLTSQKETELKIEVERSKEKLEEVTGKKVRGFRAPVFKFNKKILKAVEKAGYEYDSSAVPCPHIPEWYGSLRYPNKKFQLRSKFRGINLEEKPITVNPITKLPISGAWLRLIGKAHAKQAIKYFEKRGKPIVLYLHPWELVELPDEIKFITRFRTGSYVKDFVKWLVNKDYTFKKLKDL